MTNIWIALFRGINVGGNHILRMSELTTLLEAAGCVDVATYIQSGNAVFRSKDKNAVALARRIEKAIADAHGFEPHVLALSITDLEKMAAANPFPEGEADPKSLHLFFLDAAPKKPDLSALEALKSDSERFAIVNRIFYLHAPNGVGRSKLAARAERVLGVAATARNWRTVGKILEMAHRTE